jgi:hypothetical protein
MTYYVYRTFAYICITEMIDARYKINRLSQSPLITKADYTHFIMPTKLLTISGIFTQEDAVVLLWIIQRLMVKETEWC